MIIHSYVLGNQTNHIEAKQSCLGDGTVYDWLEGTVLTHDGIVEVYAGQGVSVFTFVMAGRRFTAHEDGDWTRRTLASRARLFAAQVAAMIAETSGVEGGAA